MKQLILTLFLFMGMAISAHAQTQVATLSHGDSIFSYYGIDALKEAYAKSANGDVITLSSGMFNAVKFAKAITVRGAGTDILLDSLSTFTEPTVIATNFTVNAGNEQQPFTMEGIVNNATMSIEHTQGAQFSKCRFKEVHIGNSSYAQTKNCNFLHCYVTNSFYGSNSKINAVACYLGGYSSYGDNNSWTINNCIIYSNARSNNGVYIYDYASLSSFRNCVLLNDNDRGYPGHFDVNSTNAYNCLFRNINRMNNPFQDYPVQYGKHELPKDIKVFEDGTFYKLTDEAKKYRGSDGTEVGIYGGTLPFSTTPDYPQIKNFKVAGQTSDNGTLHVEMEISKP